MMKSRILEKMYPTPNAMAILLTVSPLSFVVTPPAGCNREVITLLFLGIACVVRALWQLAAIEKCVLIAPVRSMVSPNRFYF